VIILLGHHFSSAKISRYGRVPQILGQFPARLIESWLMGGKSERSELLSHSRTPRTAWHIHGAHVEQELCNASHYIHRTLSSLHCLTMDHIAKRTPNITAEVNTNDSTSRPSYLYQPADRTPQEAAVDINANETTVPGTKYNR